MKKVRLTILALIVAIMAIGPGCNRHTMHMFADLAVAAATVAVAVALHDVVHHHHRHCGHAFVYYEGRPVYQYGERWEYYDEYEDQWYYYPDGLPDHPDAYYRY